jgi:hypothetical protein
MAHLLRASWLLASRCLTHLLPHQSPHFLRRGWRTVGAVLMARCPLSSPIRTMRILLLRRQESQVNALSTNEPVNVLLCCIGSRKGRTDQRQASTEAVDRTAVLFERRPSHTPVSQNHPGLISQRPGALPSGVSSPQARQTTPPGCGIHNTTACPQRTNTSGHTIIEIPTRPNPAAISQVCRVGQAERTRHLVDGEDGGVSVRPQQSQSNSSAWLRTGGRLTGEVNPADDTATGGDGGMSPDGRGIRHHRAV